MFKVTVAEYNHYSNETSDYYEVFPIKEDALSYVNTLKIKYPNVGIWIEELVPCEDDPNEYYDGKDIECLQQLCYN